MTDAIEPIDPTTTALLVLDYQTGILDRLDEPAEMLARVNTAIGWLRARGGTIGSVRSGGPSSMASCARRASTRCSSPACRRAAPCCRRSATPTTATIV